MPFTMSIKYKCPSITQSKGKNCCISVVNCYVMPLITYLLLTFLYAIAKWFIFIERSASLLTLDKLKGKNPPRILHPGNVEETKHISSQAYTQHLPTMNTTQHNVICTDNSVTSQDWEITSNYKTTDMLAVYYWSNWFKTHFIEWLDWTVFMY